jgi:flagellar motility protein MotE (MotC chaperone)
VSKKHIIIALGAGLLTFAAAFAGTWLLGRSSPTPPVETKTATAQQTETTTQPGAEGSKAAMADSQTGDEAEAVKGLTQKQLKSLVYEVREKINDYESKVKALDLREARLQMTQETLKKDIDELSRMKVELASMVANLKEQKSQLLETRAEIARSEKANLTVIAATYDKMDPASAGKILINMCAKQMESGKIEGGNIDDAVKILFYMTERTKAKLLAEVVTTEPKLAAVLCQRLKKIVEQ